MKLITEIINLKNLNKYNVDGLIINSELFSDSFENFFTIPEIEELVNLNKQHNFLLIANINRIFPEDELTKLYSYLDQLLSLDIDYFIFSDLAVLAYFKKKNQVHRLIYNAHTMITNYQDALTFNEFGIKASFIANEIKLEDIKLISENTASILDVYGYHKIFYSKRNLVSLYYEYKNIDANPHLTNYSITEKNRSDEYPIVETAHGTFIYSAFKYGIFTELNDLPHLNMIRIASEFLTEDELIKVINLYRQGIEAGFTNELFSQLLRIDPNIKTGFLYQETVLLKGEQNE